VRPQLGRGGDHDHADSLTPANHTHRRTGEMRDRNGDDVIARIVREDGASGDGFERELGGKRIATVTTGQVSQRRSSASSSANMAEATPDVEFSVAR
jgi:hypothetical protein